jgi:hypothetical protein
MMLNQTKKIFTISLAIILPLITLSTKSASASRLNILKANSNISIVTINNNVHYSQSFRLSKIKFSSKRGASKNEQHGNSNNQESYEHDVRERKEKLKTLPRYRTEKGSNSIEKYYSKSGQENEWCKSFSNT